MGAEASIIGRDWYCRMINEKRASWLEETVAWCATQLHILCDAWCLLAGIFFVQRYTYPLQWNYHWCGVRPSVLGQDRSDTKKSVLVLVLQVWCCVVKHVLVTLVVILILKDTATFQVLFIVSVFCVWNITTVWRSLS